MSYAGKMLGLVLLANLSAYLSVSFVQWDLHPDCWPVGARQSLVLLSPAYLTFFLLVSFVRET